MSLSQTIGVPLKTAFAAAAADAVEPEIAPAHDDSEGDSEYDENVLTESMLLRHKEATDFKESAERETKRVHAKAT